jgi:WD40 repeat protein
MGSSFIDCEIEENDFTGAGFLNSNFDIDRYKNNRFLGTGQPRTELTALLPELNLGHRGAVNGVAVSPDNRWIVSASDDNTIKVWDIKTGQLIYTTTMLPGHNAIAIHKKDNKFLPSPETALQYLYYTDRLASYPAKDLPELRVQEEEKRRS